MANILVLGSTRDREEVAESFAAAVGSEIVGRGHTLLGGCRSPLDALVAKAAGEAANSLGMDARDVVHSWILGGDKPVHGVGKITRSVIDDWHSLPTGLAFPEQIRQADAVVCIGGGEGTQAGATWSRFAQKPILPVGSFGGAGEEIFKLEMTRFESVYSGQVTRSEYQILNRFLPPDDLGESVVLAGEVIGLAEKLLSSTSVLVIMSFADKPHLVDAYDSFTAVCEELGFQAARVDEEGPGHKRIIPTMLEAIRRSAFVIADVSDPSPNVFYEIGYAHALNKAVYVTALEGTALPFDIADVPTLFWSSQKELRGKLLGALTAHRRV